MAEKKKLESMRCPTCGAPLKVENVKETIECVYCGNSIVPVSESTAAPQKDGAFGGSIRIDGIKTSSSALAYIEIFFEEYDWEAFAYAQTLSISEINNLANSLKISSADDKKTWFVCFNATITPFAKKILGCKQILADVVKEYKKDSLDAYSKFDAYKRISTMIECSKKSVFESLEKFIANAAKYGATDDEIDLMKSQLEQAKQHATIETFENIDEIAEIKAFDEEKNAQIVRALAAKGIDAEQEYQKALNLISVQNYVEALNVLLKLDGYADTKAIIEKIDKYYLITDILEIEKKLYYFKKEDANVETLALYPAEGEKIAAKPIIRNICNMITHYADVLYYLDGTRRLKKYNLSTNTEEKIYPKPVNSKTKYYFYKRRAFMIAKHGNAYDDGGNDLIELDLATGVVRVIAQNAKEIVSFNGNKIIYTAVAKNTNATNSWEEQERVTITNIINIDTKEIFGMGVKNITIEGFVKNYVVYTRFAPNQYNKNLYVKAMDSNESEKLIERNIYAFCDIISDKLFYYVGNSADHSLITINYDGTERKEWPLYITKVLFEQGGWVYFTRERKYNSVLCKSRIDGSKLSVIAADIQEFIDIKNGYLYYINDVDTLVKVRMDGSNQQELCENVEKVLSVKEDKIIFISNDDTITTSNYAQTTYKTIKSIYAVEFNGSGKIKLAYNVKRAKEFDENQIYFVASMPTKTKYDEERIIDTLYKLNVENYATQKMLDVQQEVEKSNGFGVAMAIMIIAFLLAFIGIGVESPGLFMIGMLVGFISLIIGLSVRYSQRDT